MEDCDPNGEPISQVRRAINKDIACYKILYEEKIKKSGKQLTLDNFVRGTPANST